MDKIEHCKKCPVRYHCKGGCYGANYDLTGKVDGQLNDECRFMLTNYEIAHKAIELWDKVGFYDKQNQRIVLPNQKSQLPPMNVDRCFCYNGLYNIPDYISKAENGDSSIEDTVLGMAQQVISKYIHDMKVEKDKKNNRN